MPLYYVPTVLIVEARCLEDADGVAEELMDLLIKLRPALLDGYTLVTGLDASPASRNWEDFNQCVEVDSNVTIAEGEAR